MSAATQPPFGGPPRRSPRRTGSPSTTSSRSRRRRRVAGLLALAPLAAALALPGVGGAAVTAPHSIGVFPSRDFVHVEGYDPGQHVTVTVHHDPALLRSLSNTGQ